MNKPEANQNRNIQEEMSGVNHRMPGQPILTVSHIMNNESNAHCQNNQGNKGNEANNPWFHTSSLGVPCHRMPEKGNR